MPSLLLARACPPDGFYFPVGQYSSTGDNFGYNCAAVNAFFVGWNNQFTVIDAVLQAAQGKVTVFELELEQELILAEFPVELRFIYDNGHSESAGLPPMQTVGIVSRQRTLMSNHNFDPGRVAWSAGIDHATTATDNCTSVYTDWARMLPLDEVAGAIGAGYIGTAPDSSFTNNLLCGGTHRGTPYHGRPECANFPDSAASDTVAGFNLGSLAGHSIVFRPWMELEDPTGLFYPYPTYQNVNPPYTPTLQ